MKKKNYRFLTKNIKKNPNYNEYKGFFFHKNTRFIISYIYSYFYNNELSNEKIEHIEKIEYKFLKLNNIKKFSIIFNELNSLLPPEYKSVRWNDLGNYFFYVWQSSRFYHDKKKNIKNIYDTGEYIKLNVEKRNYFYLWIVSIKKIDKDFNSFVLYLKNKGI